MKNEIYLDECPRCGDFGLEHLDTYAYCVGCNYNTVEDLFPFADRPTQRGINKITDKQKSVRREYLRDEKEDRVDAA